MLKLTKEVFVQINSFQTDENGSYVDSDSAIEVHQTAEKMATELTSQHQIDRQFTKPKLKTRKTRIKEICEKNVLAEIQDAPCLTNDIVNWPNNAALTYVISKPSQRSRRT